ncbi:DNA cytosine methyltransferase [Lampropedia aestuarii]|uniref:DNA cytosine methyltransferase n=1 Tax=Lampropedia aestuarii TaxID=2562762 RepID=UPI0024694528|nr:DNA cytosine methyltransferase [Lampropedia aestuarii]MDH5857764.1 DNA cytosine methyltransferase [Lampropedia aestuarii]
MITDQFILGLHSELVVDLFAGGGGASTGIELALGRHVDIAVNHDPEAISVHTANHPQTQHFCSDVFEVDPLTVTSGRPVGLLWASPDCKHFSKAKGGKPVSKKIRGLAGVVVDWVKAYATAGLPLPRIIHLENVEEFQTWGPQGDDDRPCPLRKGETFNEWVGQLRAFGYSVEWRELRACDYGAPTIRKRLFLVARCDGEPIVWPEPTHAKDGNRKNGKKAWRTAADCIDWSIPAPSIFLTKEEGRELGIKRPLADATCRRIAKGIMRYVVDAAEPFIAPLRGTSPSQTSAHSVDSPLSTISAQGTHHALVVPTLVQTGYGERAGQAPRVPGLDKPLGTVVSGQKHALVTAFLAKHYTGVVGSSLYSAVGTVTTVDHHSLVTANPIHLGHGEGKCGTKRFSHGIRDVLDPLNTITAQGAAAGLVQAFLVKYYGTDQDPQMGEPLHTVTTKDRFGLVTVHGVDYQIVDIGLRMLTPRELYRAQGFPEHYIIDRGARGEPITKTAQVRMCGNSVCPPLSHALVRANCQELIAYDTRELEIA